MEAEEKREEDVRKFNETIQEVGRQSDVVEEKILALTPMADDDVKVQLVKVGSVVELFFLRSEILHLFYSTTSKYL